jgi:hypothetical protein
MVQALGLPVVRLKHRRLRLCLLMTCRASEHFKFREARTEPVATWRQARVGESWLLERCWGCAPWGLVPGWLLVGVVPLGGADNVTVKGFVVVFPARGLSDVLCEVGVTDAA